MKLLARLRTKSGAYQDVVFFTNDAIARQIDMKKEPEIIAIGMDSIQWEWQKKGEQNGIRRINDKRKI